MAFSSNSLSRPPRSQPLTTASSSATLVEHFRAGMSSSDAPPVPRVTQITNTDPAAWAHRLSVSFDAIAEQISVASQALAAVDAPSPPGDVASALAHLTARLDAIEDTQARIGGELANVIVRVGGPHDHSETGVEEEPRGAGAVIAAQPKEEHSLAKVVEELQKKVDQLAETVRSDQACLYPRMRNATIAHQKNAITPLPTPDGKPVINFPGTKGEFEHLTKERYEHILKSYGQPAKGDTAAKREATRQFLCLPQP